MIYAHAEEDRKILLITLLSGLFVWIADAAVDFFLLKGSFLNVLVLDVPPEKLASRIFLCIYFLVMALMISWFVLKARRAEAKVDLSEQQYRRLFEGTRDGIILIDTETAEVIDANPFIEELLGYSAADLKGRKIWEISQFSKMVSGKRDLDVLCGKKFIRYSDLTLRTKKGADITVDLRANVYPVEDKETIQFNVRDLTGHRSCEEKLVLFSAVIEQSAEGLAAADMNGIILFSNKAFAEMHGYEPQEVFGKHISIFHTPEQMFAVEVANQKLKETSEFEGEIWHVRRDKKVFLGWMHNTLLRDEQGRPVGIIKTLQDITERKKAEESLMQTNSLLASTIEASFDGILVVDRAGKVRRFNHRFAEMWRIPGVILATCDDKRFLGHVVDQLKDAEGFLQGVEELYSKPEDESYDMIEFKDGRVFERHSCPQRLGEEIVGRVWTFRDVTKRKSGSPASR